MGYTKIAGTPVITGPYTMPVPMALFGSTRHLAVDSDSATAAILAGLAPLRQRLVPRSFPGRNEGAARLCGAARCERRPHSSASHRRSLSRHASSVSGDSTRPGVAARTSCDRVRKREILHRKGV